MLARRIALTHPATVSLLMLMTAFLFGVTTVNVVQLGASPLLLAAATAIAMAVVAGWVFCVWSVAAAAYPAGVGRGAWLTPWLAVVAVTAASAGPAVMLAVGGDVGLASAGFFLMLAGFAAHVMLVWRTAEALEHAAAGSVEAVSPSRLSLSFVLLFYTLIGVWVLRARIVKVAG